MEIEQDAEGCRVWCTIVFGYGFGASSLFPTTKNLVFSAVMFGGVGHWRGGGFW